jgi:hypothetical protein
MGLREVNMKGRPAPDEAVEYYAGYIKQAPGDDGLAAMKDYEPLLKTLSAITEEKSLHRYAPGKWSIRELLNHVSDTERVFAFRALWFARGFELPLPSFDQDVAVAGNTADKIPWARHVEEFRRVRQASIALYENLPSEAWLRTGTASGNKFSVRALAFIIAGHANHHVRIVREKYL